MESRDRAAQEVIDEKLRWRWRLGAWALVLVAIAFIQAPGRIATDTKLDLVVDPWGFLARATQAWDPDGALGQLQNQAYGYLFPMGPFFGVGHSLGLEPWVVQRLWWSLVLVVAFLGAVKLAGLLGVSAPWVRIVVGLLYALSPRMMSVIGASSIEVWPSAVAPWVLIPLVIASRTGRPKTGAALSALAVACVGGVNAAATFAVVPLAAWWILTRPAGVVRRRLLLWWPVCVLLATLWWIVPLLVLGAYSPPFLDLIESSSNASLAATVYDVLRGTSNWVPYVDLNAEAGRQLVSEPVLVANGVAVLALGVVGLSLRDLPHRRFLVGGVLLGLLAVTAGHASPWTGWGSDAVGTLLDGALAPVRNTHKFDLVLRLPLVLGAGLLLQHVVTARERQEPDVSAAAQFVGVSLLAVAVAWGATAPAWTASLAPDRTVAEIPPYWDEAAQWLGEHPNGTALLAPATPFGDYLWGKTGDEPMQPLAHAPWAVRNLVPLTPMGTIEMLDTLSDQFATGRGDEAFAGQLRRAGIGTVVVRHDISRSDESLSPELVRATLESTPGLVKVAEFGPVVAGAASTQVASGETVFVDHGWRAPRAAIELYQLDTGLSPQRRIDLADTPTVVGDAQALTILDRFGFEALGRAPGEDAVLTDGTATPDVSRTGAPLILTDSLRRQEVKIGAVAHQRSATMTESEPYRADRRVHQYHEDAPYLTVAELVGATAIAASSSQADVDAFPFPRSDRGVWAAFDDDPTTLWSSNPGVDDDEAWVRLEFAERRDVGTVSITLDLPPGTSRDLVVGTERGDVTVSARSGSAATVEVGTVAALRISSDTVPGEGLRIIDVELSSFEVSRPLALPVLSTDLPAPDAILLSRDVPVGTGCLEIEQVLRCQPGAQVRGDEGADLDRLVTLNAAGRYVPHLEAVTVGGAALDELVQHGRPLAATVSSRATSAPQAGASALLDGSIETGWMADPADVAPTVTVSWAVPSEVDSVAVRVGELAVTPPRAVRIELSDGSVHELELIDGRASFPATVASWMRVTLVADLPVTSMDFSGGTEDLAVGLAEIEVPGVTGSGVQPSTATESFGCGTGPTLLVGDRRIETELQASRAALLTGAPTLVRTCDPLPIELAEGETRTRVVASDAAEPTAVLLAAEEDRRAVAESQPAVVFTHNTNPGWKADQGGTELVPLVLNGWQQGWLLHDSSTHVDVAFGPETAYRGGLLGGALGVPVLGLLVWRWSRREVPLAGQEGSHEDRPGLLAYGVLVAIAGALGGWLGVVAAAGGLALGGLTWRGVRAAPLVAGTAVAVGGIWYVLRPWSDPVSWAGGHPLPQAAALVVLGAWLVPWCRRPRWASSTAGLSTRR